MKTSLLAYLLVLSTQAMAISKAELREICPFCEHQTDGTILLPERTDIFYKMKVIRFDDERISLKYLATTDLTGKPIARSLTFRTEAHRESFADDLRTSCASFLGYKYFASGFSFVKGSARSRPLEETKATFELSCWKKKTSIITRFFNYIDRKVDGDRSYIFDDLRSAGKDVPVKTYRVKEPAARQR